MTENNIKLSDVNDALRPTAGALPSSLTYGITEAALESDNIDDVKAQLTHVWAHYQSLEFFLSSTLVNANNIKAVLGADDVEQDMDPAEFITKYYAGPVIEMAYAGAHQVGLYMSLLGLDVQQALQTVYTDEAFGLDFSNPDAETPIDLVDSATDETGEPGSEPTA